MVYPRPIRPAAAKLEAPLDVEAAQVAFDGARPLDARIAALWQLRGAPAFLRVGERTLAEHLGDLLNDVDLVVGSEAYEILASLVVTGGDALFDLAVAVDKRGHVFVPGKPLEAVAAGGGGRMVPLAKIASLAPSTAAPVASWPRIAAGHDLVVERAPHPKMPAATQRVRGDVALVGSLREAALALPIPRRQLRFKRDGERWTVADVYAEGRASIGGVAVSGSVPVVHGTRIAVSGEEGVAATTVTTRLVPRLDRQVGVVVKFKDQGRRVERLAAGEALFFGPGVDDDVTASVAAHLVATPDGRAVLISAAPLPQAGAFVLVGNVGVRFEGADVVVADVTAR